MTLIDTHQHLWDPGQFPYSWCAGIPELNRPFRLADYQAAARDTGITRTVFVECDVDEPHMLAEARHVQTLAAANPLIAGIVAACRPEHADFPVQLEQLLALPQVRGVRRVLHVVPDAVSQELRFVENVRRLAPHHLTFDLCVLARQLPLALRLVRQCPDVRFVLDHCGLSGLTPEGLPAWKTGIAQLAAHPNVACKVSGLVTVAGHGWTPATLRPWIDVVVAQFGFDRLLWGGDWPVCTLAADLQSWVNATRKLFAGCSPAEQEKLFRKNAETLYRI